MNANGEVQVPLNRKLKPLRLHRLEFVERGVSEFVAVVAQAAPAVAEEDDVILGVIEFGIRAILKGLLVAVFGRQTALADKPSPATFGQKELADDGDFLRRLLRSGAKRRKYGQAVAGSAAFMA
jgi:hypothetical protein